MSSEDKTMYSELVMMIMDTEGIQESNYLCTVNYLKEFFPQVYERIQEKPGKWLEVPVNKNKSLYIKNCQGVQDFNDFVDGRFNSSYEGNGWYYDQRFFTDDDGSLICEDLFGKDPNRYYLE